MDEIFIIIKGGKIWTNLFFPTIEHARNYIKMRVPESHILKEIEENKFESKRYGTQYKIQEQLNYATEQKRLNDEFNAFTE